MKVVAVMEAVPTDGGGFNQAMNAVLQMQRLSPGRFGFAVASSDRRTVKLLAARGLEAIHLPSTWTERLQSVLLSGPIAARLRLSTRHVFAFERRLLAAGADVAYFVTPWVDARRLARLQRLCYWITVWDLAHLEHAEFPEVREFGQFHARDRYYQRALGPAALVVVDSTTLGERVCRRYGVDPARVLAMPFSPADSLDGASSASRADVLARHRLAPGFLFYPAQFWSHKNHLRIVEALHLCRERGETLHVVFAGGDRGSRARVDAAVAAMGLQAQVHCLGFVDARDMRALYDASVALVMPTYFGPTNLPPLEAWSLGVPVIYSSHLADQAGDAALLVDPDDASALADAMLACRDPARRDDLIARGHRRLLELQAERNAAELALLDRLRRTALRLMCSTPPSSRRNS